MPKRKNIVDDVQENVADEFMKKLTAAVKKITVGDTVKNPKIGKCSIYSCNWRN